MNMGGTGPVQNNQCSSEGNLHHFISDGNRVYCRNCGELEVKGEYGRDWSSAK